ncbi:MAG TPA: glycoside hydrolase family 15 protein [Bryobacteraceae bacterium]|nr:glycoside hydrolase family 15 protein [Bryobacteraceae bacterium]
MGPDIEEHDETKSQQQSPAPGRPGIVPSWCTGAKTAVGTAVTSQSRIWFTIADGHLNEIYFPDVDRANTRFVRFLISGDDHFFSDEASDAEHTVRAAGSGIPAFQISSYCTQKRYCLDKEIIADPDRDALLIKASFKALTAGTLRLYVFSNAHIGDQGEDNHAWTGEYKGIPMLFAEREGLALAIACAPSFKEMSCGFMGVSDGLIDIRANGRLTRLYTEAERGNVGLTGEIDWSSNAGSFTLALALGGRPEEAGLQARAALSRDFCDVRKQYIAGWKDFQATISDLSNANDKELVRVSASVLRVHESKRFRGAFVASLSIPWGFDRGDKDTGGYHVIWPRDLTETAFGLMACGDTGSARRALFYLACTQESDGHWNQNMWLDGTKHWTSRQIDETAFPILLADALKRSDELKGYNPWPMVKKTASYLIRNGPVAQQDRWEAIAGYATFTMAVEIAALLAAAEFAELNSEPEQAKFLRATADAWNDAIDELTYASGTELAQRCGVAGYYIRIAPPDAIRGIPLDALTIELHNRPEHEKKTRAVDVASPDALALVRYGLRSADDPRILGTVRVIDATLKSTTATGPVWRRYTKDGYGEHADGSPYKKTGVGRGWPLLAGERAHYEIAKGDFDAAEKLRRTMAAQTSECGLIPEQVWDADDIPERKLFNGHPTGSGMPLVWAHAEYLQLCRSLQEGKVWSLPPQTAARYINRRRASTFQIWTFEQQRGQVATGKDLRVDLGDATVIEWSIDCWKTVQREKTQDSGLGVHWALLPLSKAAAGTHVRFRLGMSKQEQPGGQEFQVLVC